MWNEILNVLSIIGAVIFMVFFFGFCIFIHELGHFLAAKWRGLHVTAFSIGFRKVWAKTVNGVEYRIGWIPFGGYVEIPQVDANCDKDGNVKDAQGNSYPHAKPLDRMIAVFAGPLFNILFGFVLATVIWIVGLRQDTPKFSEIKVAEVEETSPEYKAGLRKGDVIYRLNGKKFHCTWTGFVKDILFTIDEVTLDVRRDGRNFKISYLPAPNPKYQPDEEIAYPFFKPQIPVQVYPIPGSPAERMGLKDNDRILAFNGIEVKNVLHFYHLLHSVQGAEATLKVLRDGRILELKGISGELIKPSNGEKAGRWQLGFAGNPVTDVLPGMPFEKASIKEGDKVLSVNGEKTPVVVDVIKVLERSGGAEMKVVLLRDGKEMTVKVTPMYMKNYRFGATFATKEHPTPWQQFTDVIDMTIRSLRGIGISIGKKLHLTKKHTTIRPKHMSGPLGIGRVLFLSVYLASVMQGLALVVTVTFSLGLLNLLPIPVLDGGHIVLAFIELIIRRPVPKKLVDPISYAFIAILIGFMLFVTFYDVRRIVNPIVRNYEKTHPEKVQGKPLEGDKKDKGIPAHAKTPDKTNPNR